MVVNEYKSKVLEKDKLVLWRILWVIAAVFCFLVSIWLLRPQIGELFANILIFTVGLPLLLLAFYLVDQSVKQFPALLCPHCQGDLSRSRGAVIASRNCPHCGQRVLDD